MVDLKDAKIVKLEFNEEVLTIEQRIFCDTYNIEIRKVDKFSTPAEDFYECWVGKKDGPIILNVFGEACKSINTFSAIVLEYISNPKNIENIESTYNRYIGRI